MPTTITSTHRRCACGDLLDHIHEHGTTRPTGYDPPFSYDKCRGCGRVYDDPSLKERLCQLVVMAMGVDHRVRV